MGRKRGNWVKVGQHGGSVAQQGFRFEYVGFGRATTLGIQQSLNLWLLHVPAALGTCLCPFGLDSEVVGQPINSQYVVACAYGSNVSLLV